MKFIAIYALVASTSAIKTDSIPHTAGSTHIKPCDNDNYMSVRRCKDDSECQGGNECEFLYKEPIGWCRGPTACPYVTGSAWNHITYDVVNWDQSTRK